MPESALAGAEGLLMFSVNQCQGKDVPGRILDSAAYLKVSWRCRKIDGLGIRFFATVCGGRMVFYLHSLLHSLEACSFQNRPEQTRVGTGRPDES